MRIHGSTNIVMLVKCWLGNGSLMYFFTDPVSDSGIENQIPGYNSNDMG